MWAAFRASWLSPTGVAKSAFIRPACRRISVTAPSFAGRHTTAVPERQRKWRKHLSKKAKKKFKAKQDRRNAIVEANRPTPTATYAPALRRPQQMQNFQQELQSTVNMLAWEMPQVKHPQEVLASLDPQAMYEGIRSGQQDATRENFNMILRVQGARGEFEDATETVGLMQRVGVEPDLYTYTALVTACANQGNPTAACEVIDTMRRRGIQPSHVTYGSLIQSYIKADRLTDAFKVLALVEAEHIRAGPELFTHLMVGCIHKGEIERAWDTFDHMRRFHCEPDAVTMTAMISACARTDQVERALNLWEEMKQIQIEPTHVTFNALIYTAARSFRHCERAHQLFDEMQTHGLQRDVYTYNAALLACSHSGDVARARQYMYEMHQQRIQPDLVTYNTLLAVYARALAPAKRQAKPGEWDVPEGHADGKQLLKPLQTNPIPNKPKIGSGLVLVQEGNETDTVNDLLADFFNRKGYIEYLDAEQEALAQGDETTLEAQQLRAEDMLPNKMDIAANPEAAALRDEMASAGIIDKAEWDVLFNPERNGWSEAEGGSDTDAMERKVLRDDLFTRNALRQANLLADQSQVVRDTAAALDQKEAVLRKMMGDSRYEAFKSREQQMRGGGEVAPEASSSAVSRAITSDAVPGHGGQPSATTRQGDSSGSGELGETASTASAPADPLEALQKGKGSMMKRLQSLLGAAEGGRKSKAARQVSAATLKDLRQRYLEKQLADKELKQEAVDARFERGRTQAERAADEAAEAEAAAAAKAHVGKVVTTDAPATRGGRRRTRAAAAAAARTTPEAAKGSDSATRSGPGQSSATGGVPASSPDAVQTADNAATPASESAVAVPSADTAPAVVASDEEHSLERLLSPPAVSPLVQEDSDIEQHLGMSADAFVQQHQLATATGAMLQRQGTRMGFDATEAVERSDDEIRARFGLDTEWDSVTREFGGLGTHGVPIIDPSLPDTATEEAVYRRANLKSSQLPSDFIDRLGEKMLEDPLEIDQSEVLSHLHGELARGEARALQHGSDTDAEPAIDWRNSQALAVTAGSRDPVAALPPTSSISRNVAALVKAAQSPADEARKSIMSLLASRGQDPDSGVWDETTHSGSGQSDGVTLAGLSDAEHSDAMHSSTARAAAESVRELRQRIQHLEHAQANIGQGDAGYQVMLSQELQSLRSTVDILEEQFPHMHGQTAGGSGGDGSNAPASTDNSEAGRPSSEAAGGALPRVRLLDELSEVERQALDPEVDEVRWSEQHGGYVVLAADSVDAGVFEQTWAPVVARGDAQPAAQVKPGMIRRRRQGWTPDEETKARTQAAYVQPVQPVPPPTTPVAPISAGVRADRTQRASAASAATTDGWSTAGFTTPWPPESAASAGETSESVAAQTRFSLASIVQAEIGRPNDASSTAAASTPDSAAAQSIGSSSDESAVVNTRVETGSKTPVVGARRLAAADQTPLEPRLSVRHSDGSDGAALTFTDPLERPDSSVVSRDDLFSAALADLRQGGDTDVAVRGDHAAASAQTYTDPMGRRTIGPVEQALVEASQDVGMRNRRHVLDQTPSFMHALFEAQRVARGQAVDDVARVVEGGSNPLAGVDIDVGQDGGADWYLERHDGKDETSALSGESSALVQRNDEDSDQTHAVVPSYMPGGGSRDGFEMDAERRNALDRLSMLAAPGTQGALRLKATTTLAEELLGGVQWLPVPLPDHPTKRADVLIEQVETIFHETIPAAGLEPDQVTLNTVVLAYANAGRGDEAYSFVADEFEARECAPDERTYRALIKMHVSNKDTMPAIEALRDMQEQGIIPSKDSYGWIVHGLARENRLKDAIMMVREMKGKGLECPERFAFLLRERFKANHLWHPDIPAHPEAWQWTPAVRRKRKAVGRKVNIMRQTLNPHKAKKNL